MILTLLKKIEFDILLRERLPLMVGTGGNADSVKCAGCLQVSMI